MEARTTIEERLVAADRALDQAWMRNSEIAEALANARAASEQVGREPLIEDAKVVIAHRMSCTPSAAFGVLVSMSQARNQQVSDVARGLVDDPFAQFEAAPVSWRLVTVTHHGGTRGFPPARGQPRL